MRSAEGPRARARPEGTAVEVAGRRLQLSNLDKVIWPATGTTKGDLVTYYLEVAPAILPHLSGRALTLKRYPDGVEGGSFYEKNCPSHRPGWVPTSSMGGTAYCRAEEPATLVWLANLASVELHPGLGRLPDLGSPTAVVFDLDPGPPAGLMQCCRVALAVRDLLSQLGLHSWAKTSGNKGLQVYAPLNSGATYASTAPFAKAVARLLERRHPDLVLSHQQRAARTGKVLIDWAQNGASRTTVSVYSLRAAARPTVSTPVRWDEVERALGAGDADQLRFDWRAVLRRLESEGELMRPVLELSQELPELG